MFRIVVGVLAAFVGFSFGHSIPKWMENKDKSGKEMQSPSSSESAHPVRKLLLRRKPLRRFKFGSQKLGKENLEVKMPCHQLRKDIAEQTGPLPCLSSSPPCAGSQGHAERKRFKFGSQKLLKEKVKNKSSFERLELTPTLPLSAVNLDSKGRSHQDTSTNANIICSSDQHYLTDFAAGCCSLQELCTKSKIGQEVHAENGSSETSKLQEPVFCKISSVQGARESPVKEKSQMKLWKTKLMNLRSRAMVSEKVWYEKFEGQKFCGKLLAPSSLMGTAKKQGKGKENESPQLPSTKRRDLSWSRSSSSKVGLLAEAPKLSFER